MYYSKIKKNQENRQWMSNITTVVTRRYYPNQQIDWIEFTAILIATKKKKKIKKEISFIIFDTLDSNPNKTTQSPNLIFRHVKFSRGWQEYNRKIYTSPRSLPRVRVAQALQELFERWRINCWAATGARVWPNFEHVHLDLEFSPPLIHLHWILELVALAQPRDRGLWTDANGLITQFGSSIVRYPL